MKVTLPAPSCETWLEWVMVSQEKQQQQKHYNFVSQKIPCEAFFFTEPRYSNMLGDMVAAIMELGM